ncbi:hypothetical protein KFU94_67085 [Chloroflexi bacterium TSY]|nr:hypothetical protein [Chloroflexi bacterium TSY]
MLTRPPAEFLQGKKRGEQCQQLAEYNQERRTVLLKWIEEKHLCDQLVQLGSPTAFNVIFAEGTLALAEALQQAPGVLEVAQIGDLQIELLDNQ